MGRVIFLVDMNAFFISCEKTRYPEIADKPAAVAGDPKNRTGIILTANYEARKFGIKTTMVLRDAFKLCPDLIVIPPDHKFYEQKSMEVMKILSSYTPVIEQNSVDEAYLDMTGSSGIFGEPIEAAEKIMAQINQELGLWCSIGISENKFLAKMASEMKKPQGITELWKKDIETKMWPLPVNYMNGVGKQTALKLNSMGIITIKDLALFDRDFIVEKFGKSGAEIYSRANGIDTSLVSPHNSDDVKSIGRSVTLPYDITEIEVAKSIIMELSDEIGMNARNHQKKGKTVQINIKYSNFKSISRQMTVEPTYLVKEIYHAGEKLLEKNWNMDPVRLIGISLSGFYNNSESEQLSLFDIPKIMEEKIDLNKIDKVESAINSIRQKYGSAIIKHGLINIENNDKTL